MNKKNYLTPEVNITVMDTCDGLMLEVSGGKASQSLDAEGRSFFIEDENDKTSFWGK